MFEVVDKTTTGKAKDMGDFPTLFADLPDGKVLRSTLPYNTPEERAKVETEFGKGDGNKEPGVFVIQARNAAEAINKSARKKIVYRTETNEKTKKQTVTAVLEIWLGKRIGRPRKDDAAANVETPTEGAPVAVE